jgi:hypothetical protein
MPRNDDGGDGTMSYISGTGLTSYGKHEGRSSLDLMSMAAQLALDDAVTARFIQLAGRLVPYVEKTS